MAPRKQRNDPDLSPGNEAAPETTANETPVEQVTDWLNMYTQSVENITSPVGEAAFITWFNAWPPGVVRERQNFTFRARYLSEVPDVIKAVCALRKHLEEKGWSFDPPEYAAAPTPTLTPQAKAPFDETADQTKSKAPAPTTRDEETIIIPVERATMARSKNGNLYLRIAGGRYSQYGKTAWPETIPEKWNFPDGWVVNMDVDLSDKGWSAEVQTKGGKVLRLFKD